MAARCGLTSEYPEPVTREELYLAKMGGGDGTIRRIESLDEGNLVNFRDLESGSYIIYGYFSPYPDSDIAISADNSLIHVIWKSAGSHVICLDPLNAKVVFFEMLVDDTQPKGYNYTRTIIPLLELHGLIARVEDLEAKIAAMTE